MNPQTDTPESAEAMTDVELAEHIWPAPCHGVFKWEAAKRLRLLSALTMKHADTAAANAALSLKLQRCEEALRGMEALATGEGWNTPIFSAPFGAALREARSALTHPTRNEGEKKV